MIHFGGWRVVGVADGRGSGVVGRPGSGLDGHLHVRGNVVALVLGPVVRDAVGRDGDRPGPLAVVDGVVLTVADDDVGAVDRGALQDPVVARPAALLVVTEPAGQPVGTVAAF